MMTVRDLAVLLNEPAKPRADRVKWSSRIWEPRPGACGCNPFRFLLKPLPGFCQFWRTTAILRKPLPFWGQRETQGARKPKTHPPNEKRKGVKGKGRSPKKKQKASGDRGVPIVRSWWCLEMRRSPARRASRAPVAGCGLRASPKHAGPRFGGNFAGFGWIFAGTAGKQELSLSSSAKACRFVGQPEHNIDLQNVASFRRLGGLPPYTLSIKAQSGQ